MKKNNGTATLVTWTAVVLLAFGGTRVQANSWMRSGNTITDENGWVLKVAGVTGGLSLIGDAVQTKGTPSDVLDLSGAVSDGSNILQIADLAFRSSSAGTLRSVTLPNTLVTIGATVFGGQTSLTNVTPLLPATVKTIGNSAFDGIPIGGVLDISSVTNLGTIVFRNTSITSAVCGADLKTLPDRAFESCKSLRSAQLPSSLATLGINVFNGCTNLFTLTPFLPATVTAVGNSAFQSVPAPQALDLSSVTSLGNYVFRSAGLTSVVFSANLTLIDQYNFNSCKSLRSVQLPANLLTLGQNAFSACTNLYELQLPPTLVTINASALASCSRLTNVSPLLSATVTAVGDSAFSGTPLGGAMDLSSVTNLGQQAFRTASGLTSVVFSAQLVTIPFYAFEGCSGLSSAQLPVKLGTVGERAFSGCSSLTSLSPALPSTVTSIYAIAFSGVPYSNRIELLNPGYRVVNGQLFGSSKVSEWAFGVGVTNVADYAFDGTPGPCDFYFHGTAPTFKGNIIRGAAAYKCRFFAPRNDAGWDGFISTYVTPLTTAETNTYVATWPDAPLPVGGWTPTSCTRQFVVLWSPSQNANKGTVILIR